MKERKFGGYIQVTVQGSGFYHSTLIRQSGRCRVMTCTNQQVNYARSLAAAA